jgi:hypothetical protein
MTMMATVRAPASLSATAVDWALPPDTQVSSTTAMSAPATAAPTRSQSIVTPRTCTACGLTVSGTTGNGRQDVTMPSSGWRPSRPCPLGTTATAAGPSVIPAACHTACAW